MSKLDSELKDEWLGRLARLGIATDIREVPGRSEFVGVRDVTLAWAIIHCYVPPRGQIVFLDRWEYDSYEAAKAALDAWTPGKQKEPQGWTRHPATQRGGSDRSQLLKSISNRR